MNTKRKCSLIAAAAFTLATSGAGQTAKSFLSVQDILSEWQSNYGSLKSMKVSYCEKVVSAEPSPADPNFVRTSLMWNYLEKIEQEGRFRSRYSTAEEGFAKSDGIREMVFDGAYQKIYIPAEKEGRIYAGLSNRNIGTGNVLKRYLLSEPYIERPFVESEESIFSKAVKRGLTDPNFTIYVRPTLEEVAGEMCHVLELDFIRSDKEKCKTEIIWVAHEKGMFPLRHQQFDPKGAITHEMTVEQTDFAETKEGGLWFPKKASRTINLPEYFGVVKYEFNVFEFVPGIEVDPNTFQLDFPNGTRVFDAELGLNYIVGVKGY